MLYENYKGNTHIVKVTELLLEQFNPEVIMKSGQVFRFYKEESGIYTVISNNKMLEFQYLGEGNWLFYTTLTDFKSIWVKYFDFNTDYERYNNQIPSTDSFLSSAKECSQGMRILHQDLWETMVTFIISQQNNIPKIRKSVEELCKRFGNLKEYKRYSPENPTKFTKIPYYTFPTAFQIANLSVETLCDGTYLGYRGNYVLKLAQDISKLRIDLSLLERKFSPEQRMNCLLHIQGIGPKVANCIMLYGLHQMECYPIDVWMERVISEEYSHMTLEEYLQYIDESYQGFQGYIQQIQFYYKRNFKKVTD